MQTDRSYSPLDRFLRLFTQVRAGEGADAVLLSLNVFLILTAYYVLKPIREALILAEGSAELKAYISAAQVIALIPIVRVYSGLADRYPRRRLINIVTWFFIGCLPVFFLLGRAGMSLGVVFFFWVGIFNVMVVAQFWSFANDLYTEEEGERLFPLVAFGASAGGVVGTALVGQLIEPLGLFLPMIIGAVILAAELQITNWVDRRRGGPVQVAAAERPDELTRRDETGEAERGAGAGEARDEDVGGRVGGPEAPGAEEARPTEADEPREPALANGFALLLKTPYLLLIGLLVLFLNWVNTTGEYILGRVVENAAAAAVAAGQAGGLTEGQFIGDFYANFYFGVNLAALLIQLFLVSRIIKYVGIRWAVLILPLISLGAYSLIAFYPVLGYVRWAKTAENSTDYSLNNTVRHALFLPTTREEKYKAKQATDTFFWRAGDVLSALVVFVGAQLVWNTASFARFNVVLVLLWLGVSFEIGRRYQRRVEAGEAPEAPELAEPVAV